MTDDTGYIIDRLTKELSSLPEQTNRCLQHLSELGYIPLYRVNTLLQEEADSAKDEFLNDAKASGLYPETFFGRFAEDDEDIITEMLGRAVDIDEGFIFDRLPAAGEQSLSSRIIHYRLDLFGMWSFPVENPFNSATTIALKTIAEYAQCTSLEAANLLADVELFTQMLLKANPDERFILTFKPAAEVDSSLIQKLNERHRFKRQLLEDFGERSDFFKYLHKNILKKNSRNIEMTFLQKEALNPFKRFVLRLIQVHQWQEGLYEGLLDSDIGEVTLNSIIDAVKIYNATERKNIKLHRVLTYVSGGYFIFNALFFLQEYMLENDQEKYSGDAESKIISDILASTQNAGQESLNAFQLHLELIKTDVAAASTQKPAEKKGFLKRFYFGVKRFFKKIVRFSKKIFHWVVLLGKIFKGILKKVFGHFFNKLAKGIKAFIDGIKFLFGRKNIVTAKGNSVLSSVIRIDGDAVSIAINNASSLLDQHVKNIRYHTTTLAFSLAVVGGVLNIILKAISVISWPLIIFSIIKIYKKISESYKNIEFITT